MLRLRRYRIFVALTLVFLFLLYRVQVNSVRPDADADYDPTSYSYRDTADATLDKQDHVKIPQAEPAPDNKDDASLETPLKEQPLNDPPVVLTPPPVADIQEDVLVGKTDDAPPPPPNHIQKPPGAFEPTVTFAPPVHWTKLPENFPVDEASIISLPSGTPKRIPTIQHSKFATEDAAAAEERKSRMSQIKHEMKRAWDAYRTYAFGHDELVPIEKGFKDPFCGWAATLVDAMDTLWIMGLKDEFNEAYDGLKAIDFTTTPRTEIPVFETTIRYLGGLIAAYDVTGGHKGEYPMLLKKAVELAEILMGVFDTPNRMPILYYNWKPAFVSQPKRASTRAGIAEFGTLSMEFTRLAQLTGQDKYYDAVARITDALEEWQNRQDETASLLPGIFPENIDASGCNKTATHNAINDASSKAQNQAETARLGHPQRKPQGYVPNQSSSDGPGVELRDTSDTQPSKREVGHPHSPRSIEDWSSSHTAGSHPLAANGRPANWDCVAQNLTAAAGGIQQYSMGGSQDSAYEYFPKQYLLLGGLEAKYRTLHEKTVAAVKKWLLYRPMVKDTPDILFSAKAKVSTSPNLDLSDRISMEYEVTHLTCFLGGMFAMGGKIFDSDEDLDIGRRLTDGCVWAYASMPAGVMAEYAQVAPCQEINSCEWNETAWHLELDPNPEFREQSMRNYEANLRQWEENRQKALRKEAERLQAEEQFGPRSERFDKTDSESQPVGVARRDDAVQVEKRGADTKAYDSSTLDQAAVERRIKELEAILDGSATHATQPPPATGSFGGTVGQVPIDNTNALDLARALGINNKPSKPETHEEHVQSRIYAGDLPAGYTAIGSGVYTLR